MNEIYWITRLDSLYLLLVIFTIVSGITLFALLIIGYCEDLEKLIKSAKQIAIFLIISAAGLVFCPTQKEMLMILGLGQTIDYIQENETIKELPDKCVEALDAWVESLTKEEQL